MALVEGIRATTSRAGNDITFRQKHVHIDGHIINHSCHIKAKITYESVSEHVSEAVFIAALNKHVQSAIYKCEINIDGNESLEAEWWSSEKVTNTRDAQNEPPIISKRKEENCYKCIIGDIPEKTDITVSLSYVYQIPMREDELFFSLLPVATPDKGVPCNISIHIETTGGVAQIEYDQNLPLRSIPHQNKQKRKSYDVTLNEPLKQEMEVAFNIRYNKPGEVTAVCEQGNGTDEFLANDVAMVTLYPEVSTSACPSNRGEFIFIIDRSGSMDGSEITHARDTLLLFLKSLPVGCYFNIISFGSRFELLFKSGSRQYDSDSLKTACDYQAKIDANFGGTSLAPPLQALYKKKLIADHPRTVFILTDGRAWDKPEAINLVKKHSSTTTVSAFGIGCSVDKDMVNQLAKEGNGVAEYVEAFDRSMESKVMTALRLSMLTCASQFEVNMTSPGGTTAELLGFRQEAVFSGESCSFGIKLNGSHQTKKKTGKVEIKYRVGDVDMKTSCDLDWGNIPVHPDRHIHRLVAGHMMQSMMNKEDMTNKNIQDCYKSYSISANLGGKTELTKAISKPLSASHIHGVIETPVIHVPAVSVTPAASPAPSTAPVGVPRHALGLGGARRRGRIYRGSMDSCLNKSTIRKISRRAGVGRMGGLCHEEIRGVLKQFLETILKDTVLYAENGKRKMVTEQDVDCALRKNGIKIFGIENRQPLPFEKDDKKRRKFIKRSTPFGGTSVTTYLAGSALGISSTSKPAMKKTTSQKSLKKTLSKAALQKNASKTSLSRTPSNRSIGSDVTASPPKEENITRNKRQKLERKSTEILNSSSENLTLATPVSFTKPALSRVRSAMRSSTSSSSLKRQSSGATAQEPQPKVTKRQAQGKGKGKTIKGKTPVKGKKASVRGAGVSRVGSVTRGTRISHPGTSSGYKDFTTMVTMVTLQTFDGSWDMSQNLATLIGISKETLITAAPEKLKNDKSWATALALCWLEKNFGEQRTEWEMIHYKGNDWLNNQKNTITTENLMKAAAKQI